MNQRRAKLLLGGAFLLQWLLLFAITTPAWDATFYYAYARSVVFDGDLAIANDLRLSYPTTAPDFAARGLDEELTVTGRVASPFALGTSLLLLPGMALLRLGAPLGQVLGLLPAELTGYEGYFVASLATFSALLGLLAFWLAYRLARRLTGAGSALAAALVLLFTTPLLYYQFREPLYSHAPSAFVTSLVLLAWWRTEGKPGSWRQALLLGGAIGLATLVRWQHLVYAALPALSVGGWWLRLPAAERRRQLLPAGRFLALAGLATVAVFSIQLAQWQLFYGSWLTVPQGGAYVDWRAPFWRQVLFSTFRGLLPWLPIFFPALAGLLLLARRHPRLALPLITVLVLETYVNGSTRDWFSGAGFGPRRYTSELAILLLGCSALLQAVPRRPRCWLATAGGLLLGLHQWLLLRYGLEDKIGGYNLSMYPSYQWMDGSYGEYLRQIVARAPEIWRSPADFFIFPGSPLALLTRLDRFPTTHLLALLAGALLLLLLVRLGHHLQTQMGGRTLPYWLAAAALLFTNLWILLWA